MSPLQTQYPLSPRKFWKKMLDKVVLWFFLLLMLEISVVTSVMTFNILTFSITKLLVAGVGTFVVWLLIVGMYPIYVRAYIRRYFYDANENYVTIKKGVFAPAEIHIQYSKIQDVYVDQDVLDRFMGLYDVHIASATAVSGMEAHIDGVEHDAAEGLKLLLLQKIQTSGQHTIANAPAAAQVVQNATIASTPATLSEDVSSKTYPLGGAWLVQSMIGYFFSALVFTGFVLFYIALPGKDSTESLMDAFGIPPIPVGIVMFAVIFFFHVIYALVWRQTYSFAFLPEYIMRRSGIISRSEVHVPYRSVQDVRVTQSIVERMLGIASVYIENAAVVQVANRSVSSGVSIPGQTLEKANHIAEVVRSLSLSKNSSQTGL